jgi:hypothetical protein
VFLSRLSLSERAKVDSHGVAAHTPIAALFVPDIAI